MEKVLVIVADTNLYFFPGFKSDTVDFCQLFVRKTHKPFNAVKKLFPSIARLNYGDWKNRLGDIDRIVLLDSPVLQDKTLVSYIRGRRRLLPIDIYSWNMNLLPAEVSSLKKQAEKYSCGLFSYDEAFCERNGFKFNTIMFDERCKCPRVQRKSDVVFLGYSKDRSGTVAKAADLLSSAGLKLDFTVVGSAPHGVKNANITYVEGYIPYREYLKRVFGSRAIVDIAQQGQLGYSMRVMESIFYDRKLITTNAHVADAPFFEYGNVLVLDAGTTPSEVQEFMARPHMPYGDEIRGHYSVEAWAGRFSKRTGGDINA